MSYFFESLDKTIYLNKNLQIPGVKKAGHELKTNLFFDTIKFVPRNGQNEIIHRANKHKINLRYYLDGSVRHFSIDGHDIK